MAVKMCAHVALTESIKEKGEKRHPSNWHFSIIHLQAHQLFSRWSTAGHIKSVGGQDNNPQNKDESFIKVFI